MSREQPPPALSRLTTTYKMEFIDTSDISLQIKEARGIVKLQYKKSISDKIMQDIQNITRGWTAGLVLILCHIKREHLDPQMFDSFSLSEIFDYFAHEIFIKLDKSVQEFLLKIAFFPKISINMAKTITGNSQANTILSKLNYQNCFIEKRHDVMFFYEYHPLFKKFLLAIAKSHFSTNEIIQLQYKAAHLFYESGQIEDAAELYCNTNMWEDFTQLILRQAKFLMQHGLNNTLLNWIKKLPPEFLKNEPWLNYWRGACVITFNPIDAREYLIKAYKLFVSKKDYRGQLLGCLNIVHSFLNERKKLRLMEPWLIEIQYLLKENSNYSSIEIEVNVTLTMLIALILYHPTQIPDMPLSKWVERAEILIQQVTDINQYINICYFLLVYYNFTAKFNKGAFILDRLNSIDKNKQKDILPSTEILLLIAKGFYNYFLGQFKLSISIAEEALEVSKKHGIHIYSPNAIMCSIFCSLIFQDLSSAKQYLKRLDLCIQDNKLYGYLAKYFYLSAWYLWLNDDLSKSIEYIKRALSLGKQSEESISLSIFHIASAKLLIEYG